MKKRCLKCISAVLLIAILVCVVPADFSYAAMTKVAAPSQVTTFKSTENFEKEYVRCYVIDDNTLKVNYKTPLEASMFRLSLYKVGEDSGDENLDIFVDSRITPYSDGTSGYGFTYYLDVKSLRIRNGYYNLYIRRCDNAEAAMNLDYKSSGVLYKNMEIKITNGKVKILRYKDVMKYNDSIKAIGDLFDKSLYLDNTLEDIKFVLKNPSTNIYADMSWFKTSLISQVSNRITANVYTDYDKLLKIYEYTSSNFYYDTVAFQTHSYQYCNPYDNIFNYEHNVTSINSSLGRVATTCQGFSAIFIALARAQGIPSRLVYGHRLAVPSNDWLTEDNIDVRDHWWVESYVNGEWIFIDPTVGTNNKYNSTTGTWTYYGTTNYTYFDPSDEQIATSHVYMNIFPDYRYGKYISNEYEISTLQTFLNSPYNDSSYMTKGTYMDSSFSLSDKSTWGDGTKSHFMTDGSGNVMQIQWSNKGFTGSLNLPGFTKMTLLSSHHNSYESVNLSGNTNLKKVFLQNNKGLTSIDLTGCKRLSYVNATNNALKTASIYVNGATRTFEAGNNGDFSFFLYTANAKDLTVYSHPDIGYKLEGIYSTGTGNLISTSKSYYFNPQAVGYKMNFTLDPGSYKYSLYSGDSQSYKLPYIHAATKRLSELGYYEPTFYEPAIGSETAYTANIEEAVVKFQVMNDISNTGTLGKTTWAALFNTDALQMTSDYEYQQILEEYEARKLLENAAKEEMAAVKVSAKSSVDTGYIKVTWSMEGIGTPDGFEVWKASSKTGTYTLLKDSTNNTLKNISNLTIDKRYYYKVRAYKLIGEKRIYSDWSNVVSRVAK